MKTHNLNRFTRHLAYALLVLGTSLRAQTAKPAPTTTKPAAVVELDPYQVSDTKPEPFSDRNADIPRTVNDAQPYVIFSAKAIEESGAQNVEDFLKNNLTAVNQRSTNTGNTTSYGSSSDISLRGLGTTQTLILVDGRRLPNVFVAGSIYQPDLNGIPLAAIDRIEVLPTSASGIYGGSALAGVINVVRKKGYSGGEVRASYDTPVSTDAGIQTYNFFYGRSLEGGKTHLTVSAQYSKAHALTLGDRRNIFAERVARVLKNAPDFYWTSTSPFLGAGVNISSGTTSNLVLKATGASIGSNYTFLPAGTSATTPANTVAAGLAGNAGNYNFTLADVNSNGPATQYIFGFTPETKAFSVALERKMTANLDAFVQYDYNSNFALEDYNGQFTNSTISIPAASPINPFTTAVVIKTPLTLVRPRYGPSTTRTFAAGLKLRLPYQWIALLDYTWSQNTSGHYLQSVDTTPLNADILSGAFNPFVDPLLYPLSLDKYAAQQNFTFNSTLNSLAARASGPLPSLPWGQPRLTVGLESRLPGTKDGYLERNNPLTPTASSRTTYYGFAQQTQSIYAEATVPLVARNRFPLIHSLEAQVAGRIENFKVDAGTATAAQNISTGVVTYNAPILNGAPYRKAVKYESANPTLGFKYQPIEDVIIRASTGTAFLPPTTTQLLLNPVPNVALVTILDPKTNTSYNVQTIGGGDPNIQPQNARNINVGIIWQPKALRGLRLNAEYYLIKQTDAISTLTAQQVIAAFPDRVTRDPTTGLITLVNISSLNLYKRNLEGWDLSADYRLITRNLGAFTFRFRDSIVLHSKYQYSLTAPSYDVAGYPLEGGAMKYRINTTVGWENARWSTAWTTRFYDSYFEYGAAGGQLSLTNAGGADFGNNVRALGSRTVESQVFHDVVVGYNFGRIASNGRESKSILASRIFDGVSVQLGLKNVFNSAPAFSTSPFSNGLLSGYGDNRMRSIWINLKKTF